MVAKSNIVVALLIVALFDLGLRFVLPQKSFAIATPSFDTPYRSRIWYATKDFLAQPRSSDVVLLGASDMTCALYGAEATYLKSPQSELKKHYSQFLQDRLASYGSPYKSTFCFAIPGEMPSDAYFLASTLLPVRYPRAIVFSVTPRDFCDGTFNDASSTEIFKLMSKLGGTKDFDISLRSSLWDLLDYELSVLSAVYGAKQELVSRQHHLTQKLIAVFSPDQFSTLRTTPQIRRLAYLQLPEDYAPSELNDDPYDPKLLPFKTNIAEYQSRYRQFKEKTFKEQLFFLERLCQFARAQGIEVLVVNSPITSENRALIPTPVYSRFISEIPNIVRKNGGRFVDLDKTGKFKHDDFYDTIHLNGKGGEKFLAQIALCLSQSSHLTELPNVARVVR
jgi:hypothetical protein